MDEIVTRWIGWCPRCRAEVEGEAGFLPDFDCELCGHAVELVAPVDLAARLVAEHARALLPRSRRAPAQPAEGGRRKLLAPRAVAAALGKRRSYVDAHIALGRIATIPVGGRRRVAITEVERVLREGLPLLPNEGAPGRTIKTRRKPPGGGRQVANGIVSGAAPELRTFRAARG